MSEPLQPLGEAPRLPEVEWTLERLALHLGWGALSAEAAFQFAVHRERLLRGAQALLETHKSNAPTAEGAIRERIETLVAEGAARRGPPCQTCQGRGWVMHTEHHDLGNGLASGGAWNEPCPDCALVRSSAPPQPENAEEKDDQARVDK